MIIPSVDDSPTQHAMCSSSGPSLSRANTLILSLYLSVSPSGVVGSLVRATEPELPHTRAFTLSSCVFHVSTGSVSTLLLVIFESLHCSLCRPRSEGFSDSFSCCFACCLSCCFVFSVSAIQSTENLCLSRITENLDRQAPKVQIARHSEGASSTLSRTQIAPYMFVNSMG